MIDLDTLVGMTEAAALEKIAAEGFKVRIRSKDGVGRMGDMRAARDRVNLYIENNLVTKAYVG